MSDVQSRHCRPAAAAALEYRPRSAVSIPPLARQPARTPNRGGQVGSVRARFASVVERLIGTVRREYLDRMFFWNAVDLTRKLEAFRDYYNASRVHRSLDGATPPQRTGAKPPAPAAFDQYAWQQHCRGLL